MSGYIYIASPYSSPKGAVRRQRAHEVRLFTERLLRDEIAAFSPVAYAHAFKYDESIKWLALDKDWLQRSRGVVFLKLKGWQKSLGMKMERKWAEEWQLPSCYATPWEELPRWVYSPLPGAR